MTTDYTNGTDKKMTEGVVPVERRVALGAVGWVDVGCWGGFYFGSCTHGLEARVTKEVAR